MFYFKKPGLDKIIGCGAALSVVLFLFLLNFFYPRLLQYQAGMMAGKYLSNNKITNPAGLLNAWSYSFEFYAPGFVGYVKSIDELNGFIGKDSAASLYTTGNTLLELKQKGYQFNVLKELPFFHISMLTGSFLNPATRDAQLDKMILISVKKKG